MLLTVTVLALLAVAQADSQENVKVTEKRGVSSPSASSIAQQQAYATKLRQYEQAQAQAQAEAPSSAGVQYLQQNSKYTASPVDYTSGAAPSVQYQSQQQAAAYAQSALKQGSAPTYSKAAYHSAQPSPAQHYSLAADVSSFSYSSPIVKYSNLGLVSQTTGKLSDETAITYQSAAPAPAPKANYYQTAAAPSPVQTRVQYVPQYESYPQEEQRSAQPAQNYVLASPKYITAPAAPQQRYIYVSAQETGQSQAQSSGNAPQRYVYQAVPQSQYEAQSQQTQYERQVYQHQQQAAPSGQHASLAQIPQQYQPVQYFRQTPSKSGIVYAN